MKKINLFSPNTLLIPNNYHDSHFGNEQYKSLRNKFPDMYQRGNVGTSKMPKQVKVFAIKMGNPNLILGAQMIEGENQLL